MGEENPREQLARMKAEMDQAREAIREIPGILWAFYSGCIESGFTEEHALMLTLEYMGLTFGGSAE